MPDQPPMQIPLTSQLSLHVSSNNAGILQNSKIDMVHHKSVKIFKNPETTAVNNDQLTGGELGIASYLFTPFKPKYQPETVFSGWHLGYHPNTNQKRQFWLGIWDTTQQPEHTFSGWCSGYYLKTSQKTFSGWAFGMQPNNQPQHIFWLVLGISPKYQPEKTVLAGHLGYNPTTRAHIFWLVLGILSENQPENMFWLVFR
ncbi:hypothetical protein BYT27DRAFT_7217434 [Phlegmacium glaucopus]|nr:hypothetical protein BYT27DRAFT_7217434 [Phlegmacium glaucopus]